MPDPQDPSLHPGLSRLVASVGIAACLTLVVIGLGDAVPGPFAMLFMTVAILGAALLGGNVHVGSELFAGAVFLLVLSTVVWVVLRLLDRHRAGPVGWIGRVVGAALGALAATAGVRLASQLVLWGATHPEVVFCVATAAVGCAIAAYAPRPLEALGPAAVGLLAGIATVVAPQENGGALPARVAQVARLAWSREALPLGAMTLSMVAAWVLLRFALGALVGGGRPSLVLGLAVAILAGVALVAAATPSSPPMAEQAWGGTEVVRDAALKALLAPGRPLEADEIRIGTDRATYYVARFVREPPPGYIETYEREIRRRGVLIRAITPSPHAVLQSILGYEFVLLRIDPARPYTLLWSEYRDSRYPTAVVPWRGLPDAPSPFRLDGKMLIVRLGTPSDAVWKETEVVPTRDVADVEEFPFPRFPGSVLVEAPTSSRVLASGPPDVGRAYGVTAPLAHVLAHYEETWRQSGFDVVRRGEGLDARGARGANVSLLTLEPWSPPVARGVPLSLSELPRLAPDLLASSPAWPTFYRIRATFVDAGKAADFREDARRAGTVGVLACGYSAAAEDFVRASGHVSVRLGPGEDLPDVPVWLISVGGLSEARRNEAFSGRLARHVERGGTLVVLAQESGRDYAALPVPRGERLEAWGWAQDSSTHSEALYAEAVYAELEHPVLASVVSTPLASNLDGHFERLPANATVLLRRTKDGAPAMAAYRVGAGMVIVSTSYDVGGVDRWGPGSPGILRDALTWAVDPASVPTGVPGQAAKLRLRVANRGAQRASAVRITVMTPGRERVAAGQTVAAPVPPGGNVEVPFTVTLEPDAPPGLYTVDYTLLDKGGAIVQRTERDGVARLAVSRPPLRRFTPPDLTAAVMSPDGEEAVVGRPFRMRYVVENHGRRTRHVRIYVQVGPTKARLIGPRTLSSGERAAGEEMATLRLGQKGFWVHVFEDREPSGRCPPWVAKAVDGESGGCQAADGEGMRLRPPSTP
jgi:hypothetical protein